MIHPSPPSPPTYTHHIALVGVSTVSDAGCARDITAGHRDGAVPVLGPLQLRTRRGRRRVRRAGARRGWVCAPAFFQGLRDICDKNGLLFIVVEVQSGFGRAGRIFNIEYSGVRSDFLIMAKVGPTLSLHRPR